MNTLYQRMPSQKTAIRRFCTLLLSLLMTCTITNLKASHAIGAEITWDCISPNQYRITLTTYRDCNGVSMGAAANISINRCGSNQTLTVTQVSPPSDLTPLCPTATSRCNGGGTVGYEAYVYQGTIVFPPGCDNIQLSYAVCCRNSIITTLSNPTGQNIVVTATLNNTLTPCDHGPRFTNEPSVLICRNEPTFYNPGGYDPDGDSLRYSLVPCLRAAPSTIVNYNAGFSGISPLTTASGISFDPSTGAMSFTPTALQSGVICVMVEEFRNGVLIGSTRRDMQFTVMNCGNQLPMAVGIDPFTGIAFINDTLTACYGHPLCIDIMGIDPNVGTVSMTCNLNNIPGNPSFNTTQISTDTVLGQFCWTTNLSHVGVYVFTVTVADDHCPIFGENTYTVVLNIIDNQNPNIVAPPDITICTGDTVLLEATALPPALPTVVDSVRWLGAGIIGSPYGMAITAVPSNSTLYQVTIYYSDGCVSQDWVTITVNNTLELSFYNTGQHLCPSSTVNLIAQTNFQNTVYEWFDPDGLPLGSGMVNGVQSYLSITVPNLSDTTICYQVAASSPSLFCADTAYNCVNIAGLATNITCQQIYVSPTGNPTSLGTQNDPTTLEQALLNATCNGVHIKMAMGIYNLDSTLFVGSNTTIEGGFDPANGWRKTSQQGATTIHRTAVNPIGVPNAYHLMAFNVISGSGFRFQDLTITTTNAVLLGTSTYGIRLENCSDYSIVRCHIRPGAAGDGANGTAGTDGTYGMDGINGTNATAASTAFVAGGGHGGDGGGFSGFGNNGSGGDGGASPPNVPSAGQAGGNATSTSFAGGGGGGGGSGTVCCPALLIAQFGGGGGAGGIPPDIFGVGGGLNNATCSSGNPGGIGTIGPNGANAPTISSLTCAYYLPQQALNGQFGSGGAGGCGGNGANVASPHNGGGGGGGGGGGSGGQGGVGGFSGAASIGIYLFNNRANGIIKDCNILPSAAGTGGIGGAGGVGGLGGNGGMGGTSSNGVLAGSGGAGGKGGNGGAGGNGASGVSQAILYSTCGSNQALVSSDTTFNLAGQAVIRATNVNCTHQNITYTANALPIQSGVANWNFSVGNNHAQPTTGLDNPGITQYDSVGHYSISQAGQVYSDFHYIGLSSVAKPEIICSQGAQDTLQFCLGDFVTFSTLAIADSFSWNFNGLIPNPGNVALVSNHQLTLTGFYALTLEGFTDCCGASPMDTIWVLVQPLPSPTALLATHDICEGESTILTLNGLVASDSVIWSPTNFLTRTGQGTVMVNPLDTTIYTATIYATTNLGATAYLGCPTDVIFEVNVRPGIYINTVSTDVQCAGNGSVLATISGGTGLYNFSWSNATLHTNAVSSTITGLSVGSYCVTAVDNGSGCSNTACATVLTQPSGLQIVLNSTSSPSCHGDNSGVIVINTNHGIGSVTYNWSDGGTTGTRVNLAAGNYCVTATDSIGCQDIVCYTITEPSAFSAAVTVLDSVSCNEGRLLALGMGGIAPYTFVWSNFVTTSVNTGLSIGFYETTVVDANGCTATASGSLPTQDYMTVSVFQSGFISCFGDTTGAISAGSNDGAGPYFIELIGPVSRTATQALAAPLVNFNNLPSGSYSVIVTHQNGGCVDSVTVLIAEPTALSNQLNVDVPLLCHGAATAQLSATTSGGTAPYFYQWLGSGFSPNPTVSGMSAGTYAVSVVDNNSCWRVDTIVITTPEPIHISDTILLGASCYTSKDVLLTVSGGTAPYTYLWPNGQTNALAVGLLGGDYTVTVMDANGCQQTKLVQIFNPSTLGVSIVALSDYNGHAISCPGASDGILEVNIGGGTGGYTYLWQNGTTTALVSGLSAGRHEVTITDALGCEFVRDQWLYEPTALNLFLQVGSAHCTTAGEGQLQGITSGGTAPYTYQWSTGATGAMISNLQPGPYEVTVTDGNGCTTQTATTLSPPIVSNFTVLHANCLGNNGAINVYVAPGGNYSFSWSNGQTTQNVSGLGAGNYAVQINNNLGCTIVHNVLIQGGGNNSVTTNITHANCQNAQGAIDQSLFGFNSPLFLWNTGATTEDISGLNAGYYACTVSDTVLGCTVIKNYTVNMPSSCHVTISGYVRDIYNTGVCASLNAINVQNRMVRLQPLGLITYTNSMGLYHFSGLAPGNYTIEFVDTQNMYIKNCPVSGTITLNNTQFSTNYPYNDFYVTSIYPNDLSIDVWVSGWVRSGLSSTFPLIFRNMGVTTQSGTIEYHYDALLSYWGTSYNSCGSGCTVVNDAANHVLYISFSNLLPNNTIQFNLAFLVAQNLPNGTSICNWGDIYPLAGDATPHNNTDTICALVNNAYDPNDKQVSPIRFGNEFDGGIIFEEDTSLQYTIRFQNVGTAPAHRVVIRDTLAMDLIAETIRDVHISHQGQLSLEDGHILVCTFDSIELPHLAFDTVGSNGFLSFRIDRRGGLPLGTTIQNQAAIYFDFNPPIITNMTTAIVGLPNAVITTKKPMDLEMELYPNPSSGALNIVLPGLEEQRLLLTDILGRVLLETSADERSSLSWDLSDYPSGTYFVVLQSNKKTIARKLVLSR